MRRFALLMLLAAGVAGCATTSRQAASSIQGEPAEAMALDAGHQLALLYPAAATQFNLRQRSDSDFGVALVKALRDQGFAVLEQERSSDRNAEAANKVEAAKGNDLRYAVVELGDGSGLYGVTVNVGSRALTRAYTDVGGNVSPAGAWVRKE